MLPPMKTEFGSDDTAVMSGFGYKVFSTIFEVNVAKGVKIRSRLPHKIFHFLYSRVEKLVQELFSLVDSCLCPRTVIRNRQAFANVEMGVGNTIEAKFMARRERPRCSDFGCQARQTPTG